MSAPSYETELFLFFLPSLSKSKNMTNEECFTVLCIELLQREQFFLWPEQCHCTHISQPLVFSERERPEQEAKDQVQWFICTISRESAFNEIHFQTDTYNTFGVYLSFHFQKLFRLLMSLHMCLLLSAILLSSLFFFFTSLALFNCCWCEGGTSDDCSFNVINKTMVHSRQGDKK